jgi:phosphatidylglycerophosphate synthase
VKVDAILYFTSEHDAEHALLRVAGRPVAFRAVMAAIRAGVDRVFVPGALRGTDLERLVTRHPTARSHVVWVEVGSSLPDRSLLLLPASCALTREALQSIFAPPGVVLVDPTSAVAAAGVVASAPAASLWTALVAGKPLGDAAARLLAESERRRVTDQPFVHVRHARDATRVAARVLADLGSAIDSPLDRALHRRLSRPVSLASVSLGITPNAITLASLVVGLVSVGFLAYGTATAALAGFALYVVAVVLDHSDGEVARLTFSESRHGEWLDVTVDTVVHTLVVTAMGVATERATGTGLVLGLVAAAGVVGSAWVVKTSQAEAGANALLAGLANRDGFYAMLLLFVGLLAALPRALPLLMLLVAAGANAYWLAWLVYRVWRARRTNTLRNPK